MAWKFNPFTGNLDYYESGATIPGNDTEIIFNDGGSFGTEAAFTYDKSTNTLDVDNINIPYTVSGTGFITMNGEIFISAFGGIDTTRNLFIGFAGNTTATGSPNLGIGQLALSSIEDGKSNFGLGVSSLQSLTSGSYNVALGNLSLQNIVTNSKNTCFGVLSGQGCTGDENVLAGYYASPYPGDKNVVIGAYTVYNGNYVSISNSVIIGHGAGDLLSENEAISGNVFIGYQAGAQFTDVSDTLCIDNTNTTTPLLGGNFSTGRLGICVGITPTARLELPAGTATVNTAPLKFNAGTNLTSAEAGAVEFDGTNLYFTDSTPTRQTLQKVSEKGQANGYAELDGTGKVPSGQLPAAGSGDMLAATYDPTNVAGDAFDCDNHASGTTNKVYTSTEQTKLSGIETGATVGADWTTNVSNKPTLGTASAQDVEDILGAVYPIGCIYVSTVSTNPNTVFGFGTWTSFGAGRVLVGLDSGDTDFDTVEETGGAKTVQSSAQTFAGTQTTTVINHVHLETYTTTTTGNFVGFTSVDTSSGGTGGTPSGVTNTGLSTANPTGGATNYTPEGTNTPGAATSVVQPYIVVYFWKRTA